MISFMIPYILEHIPQAKFIHIVRDGRAVTLSWSKKVGKIIQENIGLYENSEFGISNMDLLTHCAGSWSRHIEEIDYQKRVNNLIDNSVLYEFKYEDFCLGPKKYLCQLADFMEIDPDFFIKRNYSHIQTKNYKFIQELDSEKLRILNQIMEPSLHRFGYL